MSSQLEGGSPLQISTIADTWIHLNYLMQGGERNRGLSIIKSRGTAHSNQVRELILSDDGVTLADTYTAGGEVLMGTIVRQSFNNQPMLVQRMSGRMVRIRGSRAWRMLDLTSARGAASRPAIHCANPLDRATLPARKWLRLQKIGTTAHQ